MLTIGQMSKICGVSVKTLHHYDKIGLLRPEKIDGETGYRYYEDGQIATMLLIGRLKRYGCRLSQIQLLLEQPPEQLLGELQKQKTRLEWQMNHLSLIIREMEHHIDNLERTGDIMSYQNQYEVKLEQAPEQLLLTTRHHMSLDDFGKYYGVLYGKIAREGIAVNGVVMTIYHDKEFDPAGSDMELGVGVCRREQANTVLPAQFCATTVHVGPYSGLADAYGTMVTWIHLHGYEMDGAPYEIYQKSQFDGLSPDQWETKIYFPVKRK